MKEFKVVVKLDIDVVPIDANPSIEDKAKLDCIKGALLRMKYIWVDELKEKINNLMFKPPDIIGKKVVIIERNRYENSIPS